MAAELKKNYDSKKFDSLDIHTLGFGSDHDP